MLASGRRTTIPTTLKFNAALPWQFCGGAASLSATAGVVQSRSSTLWRHLVTSLAAMTDESRVEEKSSHVNHETALVSAAVDGDGEAFRRIVEEHQSSIAQQMRRFSRDSSVVEELTHDVFVEAFTSLSSWRGSSPLIHWLRKIAVRVGYHYWKRKKRSAERSVPLSYVQKRLDRLMSGATVQPSEAAELRSSLIESLSVRDRLVLTLLYWDGCSVDEAAELSGWSRTMVKVQAHRARVRLRKLIEESDA